jgi:S-DNA-T family DNA segregation ATPase FtsK/SpoIIIE
MASERNSKDGIMGWRYAWGIILIPICLVTALGLFSYSPNDVIFNKVPPNEPAVNLIGSVGAYLSYVLFWWLGLAAYLVPIAAIIFAVVFLFDREERVWPHVAWFTLAMTALTNLLELHGHGSQIVAFCKNINIVDPGGLFSFYLTAKCLMPLFSHVGTGFILWAVFLGAMVMTFGIPNVMALGRLIRRGVNWVIVSYNLRREETLDKKESIEREERKIKRQMRLLEKENELDTPATGSKPATRSERTLAPEPVKSRTRTPEPVDEEDAELELPVAEKNTPRATRVKPESKPEPIPDSIPEPVAEPVKKPYQPTPKPTPAPKTEQVLIPTPVPVPRTVGGKPYLLPPVTLLNELPAIRDAGPSVDEGTTGRILVETLAEFGIEVEIVASTRGPVVTSYELLPAPGVRVEKIMALSNNISLSLKSAGVRVQAPIPGKGVVGIEVPNLSSTMVCMREIVESALWQSDKLHLPLALGKDVAGNDLVVDLAAMPHLLIAGATGAGKTVCMNSILVGLLMARSPEELRMILVDPKIVEFSIYNNLPHLVVPVVTNPKKVALALRWAITEMEKRYKLFAKVSVRNIDGFNTRPLVKQPELFAPADAAETVDKNDGIPDKVPYIVIVIDELADLMLADQAEIENCIARLAQLSRAVGIHMIIATQRPSVNVITGTIKANFPARIAFQVAQKVDSRTILDTIGADKLLGKGDMLYLQPSNSKVIRAQGTMTKDEEINRIVDFIKKQGEPVFENEIHEKLERTTAATMDGGQEDDELIDKAIEVIRETQRASTSSLQRRMRIGYTRAARIIDILEERGIVGPPRGADAREILIDLDVDQTPKVKPPPPAEVPTDENGE